MCSCVGTRTFPPNVATFFCAGHLIFDVNASCTSFYKHFGELHHRSQATMPSVGISDDGNQVICGRVLRPPLGTLPHAKLHLLPIMEMLSLEQLVALVWDSVHRVIRQIWPWFI
jgi:hypothetical protein